jgi:hypothetical protein
MHSGKKHVSKVNTGCWSIPRPNSNCSTKEVLYLDKSGHRGSYEKGLTFYEPALEIVKTVQTTQCCTTEAAGREPTTHTTLILGFSSNGPMIFAMRFEVKLMIFAMPFEV